MSRIVLLFLARTCLIAVLIAGWCLTGCTTFKESRTPGMELSHYLAQTRDAQTFPIQNLYKPPSEEDYGKLFLLTRSPVILDLYAPREGDLEPAKATAFSAWRKGLAVGYGDGQVRVFGPMSCSGLAEPLPGPVDLIAWGPFSRFLIASDTSRAKAYLVDIQACTVLETVDTLPGLGAAAISDVGASMALMDSAGRLRMGEPLDALEPVLDLPDDFIGLAYTPGEGVLTVMAASGQATLVNVRSGEIMEQIMVEGGPFAGVRFVEQVMALETRFGTRIAYDLVERKPVPYARQLDQFFLDDTGLRYRTWSDVLHVKGISGWPGLKVEYSPSLDVVRVWDVDQSLRYYDLRDGLERPCVAAQDWKPVKTNEKGNFCLDKRCFILSDVAFQWDHDQMLCRWLPGQGYYFWWLKTERPMQYSPLPDHLPQRYSILADRPAIWYPVLTPVDFP